MNKASQCIPTQSSAWEALSKPKAWEGPRDWGEHGSAQAPTSTVRCSSRRNYLSSQNLRKLKHLNCLQVTSSWSQLAFSLALPPLSTPYHSQREIQGKIKMKKIGKPHLVMKGQTEHPCCNPPLAGGAISETPAEEICSFSETCPHHVLQAHPPWWAQPEIFIREYPLNMGKLQRPHLDEGLKILEGECLPSSRNTKCQTSHIFIADFCNKSHSISPHQKIFVSILRSLSLMTSKGALSHPGNQASLECK